VKSKHQSGTGRPTSGKLVEIQIFKNCTQIDIFQKIDIFL